MIGIVGISKKYLKEDNSRTMIQRNGGTDDCENEFAERRQRNNKPSSFDCNQITSRKQVCVHILLRRKQKIIQVEIQNFGQMN